MDVSSVIVKEFHSVVYPLEYIAAIFSDQVLNDITLYSIGHHSTRFQLRVVVVHQVHVIQYSVVSLFIR